MANVPAPTPYEPGNVDDMIDAISAAGLATLCNLFLPYTVDADTGLDALRYTVREGFERELLYGGAIVETYQREQEATAELEAA